MHYWHTAPIEQSRDSLTYEQFSKIIHTKVNPRTYVVTVPQSGAPASPNIDFCFSPSLPKDTSVTIQDLREIIEELSWDFRQLFSVFKNNLSVSYENTMHSYNSISQVLEVFFESNKHGKDNLDSGKLKKIFDVFKDKDCDLVNCRLLFIAISGVLAQVLAGNAHEKGTKECPFFCMRWVAYLIFFVPNRQTLARKSEYDIQFTRHKQNKFHRILGN